MDGTEGIKLTKITKFEFDTENLEFEVTDID